jgi:hypothetical protein
MCRSARHARWSGEDRDASAWNHSAFEFDGVFSITGGCYSMDRKILFSGWLQVAHHTQASD